MTWPSSSAHRAPPRLRSSTPPWDCPAASFGLTNTPSRAIDLDPAAPPPGVVGRPYRIAIGASGLGGPFGFTLRGELPPGLTLGSGGEISGWPAAVGELVITVEARSSLGASGLGSYPIVIEPARIFLTEVSS